MKPQSLTALLSTNSYPGRGIVLGRSPDGKQAVAAYFIMGRSTNSRNRVFVPTEDGIRTQAHDPAAMTDPSLIIYHPVRLWNGALIVTNGDQTDTVRDAFAEDAGNVSGNGTAGKVSNMDAGSAAGMDAGNAAVYSERFACALNTRTFEPDPPHYTPRISGLLLPDGSFRLSILKSADGNPESRCHFVYAYNNPPAGEGRFLHTYQGDGNPLPSFAGEPVRVTLGADGPDALADALWNALNADNRVSLFVRYTDLSSGAYRDAVRNRYE